MKSRSLRRRLFERLLPAVIVVALLGGFMTYAVGRHSANLAYDQALMAAAIDVATGVRVRDDRLEFELSPQSEKILRSDLRDDIFFAVRDGDARFIAGDNDLSVVPAVRLGAGSSVDVGFRRGTVRAIAMEFDAGGKPFSVTVAETMRKRQAAAWSTVALIMAPTLLGLVLLLGIIWFAVKASLAPLDLLSAEIERRSDVDLSPIDVEGAPREVQALVQATNKLMGRVEESARSYQTFVADTAHQLRTPLARILTDVDLIETSIVDRTMGRKFGRLRQSIQRSTRLLNQLLLLAHSQGDANSLQAAEIDLADQVAASADVWVHQAVEREIDLGFELHIAPVVGDLFLMREMIENLMDNALRYTPPRGSITLATTVEANEVVISLDDSGRGVAPGDRDAIFTRFNQVGDRAGSGLGLSIVRRIARRHGGDVSITDSALGGARFEVRLPLAHAAPWNATT